MMCTRNPVVPVDGPDVALIPGVAASISDVLGSGMVLTTCEVGRTRDDVRRQC